MKNRDDNRTAFSPPGRKLSGVFVRAERVDCAARADSVDSVLSHSNILIYRRIKS